MAKPINARLEKRRKAARFQLQKLGVDANLNTIAERLEEWDAIAEKHRFRTSLDVSSESMQRTLPFTASLRRTSPSKY